MNAVLSTAISSSSVSSSASCFCGVRWAALRGDTPPPAPGDHSPPGSQSPHGARVATSQPGSTGSGGDEAGAVVGTWWPRRGHLQRWGGGGLSSSHIWLCTAGELRDCWAWPEGGDGDGDRTGFYGPNLRPVAGLRSAGGRRGVQRRLLPITLALRLAPPPTGPPIGPFSGCQPQPLHLPLSPLSCQGVSCAQLQPPWGGIQALAGDTGTPILVPPPPPARVKIKLIPSLPPKGFI